MSTRGYVAWLIVGFPLGVITLSVGMSTLNRWVFRIIRGEPEVGGE